MATIVANKKARTRVDSQEALLDGTTPVAAYDTLRRVLPGASFLLESAPAPDECSRFSIIGVGAIAQLVARRNGVTIQTNGADTRMPPAELLQACRRLLHDYAPSDGEAGRFLGAYGVASFELAGCFENLGPAGEEDANIPDMHLIVPNLVVVFDHLTHRVSASVLTAGQEAEFSAVEVLALLRDARLAEVSLAEFEGISRQTSAARYCRDVEQAKEAIVAGEALQIVLSQEWRVRSASDPLHVYRSLRSINPSPYMFYVDFGYGQLLGSSPEALCRSDGRRARIRPLAGTRPRPLDRSSERAVAAELQRDPKERAEHVMLVDLARNDLGRVCRYGTVDASDLFSVERYSHVLHLASEVQGTLREDCDAFDLFAATYPAGTVSGAPKIRALQIIGELESAARGTYGGSVVYFGFDGSLDACITLRSAFVSDGNYSVRAGAGIVADSVAEREEAECRAKAGAVLAALNVPQQAAL